MPERHVSASHVALVADFILRAAVDREQQLVDELLACQVTDSQIALSCIDCWVRTLHGTRVDADRFISCMGDLDTEPVERAVSIIGGLQGAPGVRSLVPVLFDELGGDQGPVTEVALAIIAGYHRDRQRGGA